MRTTIKKKILLHKDGGSGGIVVLSVDGMTEANQLATDCIKTLKDTNWAESSQMSEDNLKEFLEFLFYEFHIPEETSRSCLTLNFKPGSKVVDFVSVLEVKMWEHHYSMDIIPAVAAPIRSTSKTSLLCKYCKQTGHLAFDCPRRKDSNKPNPQHRDSTSKRYTDHRYDSVNSHYPRITYSTSQMKSGFCHIYGACSHNTDKCLIVKKFRDEHKNQHPRDSRTQSSPPLKKRGEA